MKGKEKCNALKEIRKQIADENDIPYVVSQCTHKGDCKGTCPKCEAELKYLERELAIRQGLGKAVAIVGISMGVCSSLTACSPIQPIVNFIDNITDNDDLEGEAVPIEGDMPAPEDTLTDGDFIEEPSYTLPDAEKP
ncbi:MAG TPA: hypothetical protein VJY54_11685 [Lachnospiraceae bacterium]|nr:hypothetical protein [Lachnospiraceae bacterium]